MEPILVEDYKYNLVPTTVNNILQYLKNLDPTYTNNDVLVCLIYIIILENGFVPKEDYDDSNINTHSFDYQYVKTFSKKLPIGWKRHHMYNFSFVLPPFPQNEIQVVCLTSVDDFLVNCIINDIEEAWFTVCLDPLLYFATFHCDVNNLNLQNVRHLSKTVKDSIGFRAKQTILQKYEIMSECFDQLPPELVLLLMSYLDVKSLINLGQVNSLCNRLMKTQKLWIKLLLKDYPAVMTKEAMLRLKHANYENLRNIYKKYFLQRIPQLVRVNSLYLFNLFNIHL